MTVWIVIPVKAPAACKTRLSSVLGRVDRQNLVAEMLSRTITAAAGAVGIEQVRLLGPCRHGVSHAIGMLDDPGNGLNAALASARDAALSAGIKRLILLSADLPMIGTMDIAALLDISENVIACAPDLAGQGTNALSLPLPQAVNFQFRYGKASFAAHRAEAGRLNLPFSAIVRNGLGFDIDQPDDLKKWSLGTCVVC